MLTLPPADLDIWKSFSDAEFKYFKQTFPSDPEGEFYNEAMVTMKELAKKEVLCESDFLFRPWLRLR